MGPRAGQARGRRVRGNAEVDGRGCLRISMFLSGPRINYPSPYRVVEGLGERTTTLQPFFKEANSLAAGAARLAESVL